MQSGVKFIIEAPLMAFVPSDLLGTFLRADDNRAGSCGACQIVFFPYLVAWNDSTQLDGSYDNVTVVAPVLVTIDNSTNITSTQTMSAETGHILPNDRPAVTSFTITVSNGSPFTMSTTGDFIFTTVMYTAVAFFHLLGS